MTAGGEAGGEAGGGAGRRGSLGPEWCVALLLCWLCCWPDDNSSDTSSSRKHSRKQANLEAGSHRRSGDFFSRRFGSSAVSLHLPSTSGSTKLPLSAHRSHEEIRSGRRCRLEAEDPDARYHSAPSVIDEVVHRRHWERSTRDLHIPLKPPELDSIKSNLSTPDITLAEPESSSIECLQTEVLKCKKHHTNIKSSKGKKCKESNKDDIKDTDATEVLSSSFFIGDNDHAELKVDNDFVEIEKVIEERSRSIYKAKDAKQTFNETMKSKEVPNVSTEAEFGDHSRLYRFCLQDDVDGVDRSGATHHTMESRLSFAMPFPPPSVAALDYDVGACYLRELPRAVPWAAGGAGGGAGGTCPGVAAGGAAGGGAVRHASDGDILAPTHRPESGAFSESDLELERRLPLGEPGPEPGPATRNARGKETAI